MLHRSVVPTCCLTLLLAGSAAAQVVPPSITFTGRLQSSGAPVTGTHAMAFRIFAAPTAGSSLWSEAHPTVDFGTSGLISLELGSVSSLGAGVFDGRKLYLEVEVDSQTLSPRMALVSVPYALRADVANSAARLGTLSQTDVVTNVVAGSGLSGGGAGGTQTIGLATCGNGLVLMSTGAAWQCSAPVTFGTAMGTAAEGNDPRLSDARTPVAGSSSYIQNTTSAQSASFNVASGTVRGDLTVSAPGKVLGELAGTWQGVRAFRKTGNNGTVNCDNYCGNVGSTWGPAGACLAAFGEGTGNMGLVYGCLDDPPGINNNLACICLEDDASESSNHGGGRTVNGRLTVSSDFSVGGLVRSELRTVDATGQTRLWGEGRFGTNRYGTTGVESGLCTNGAFRFGLSGTIVTWSGAKAGCPSGTWMCTDAERGNAPCDTARPDSNCDYVSYLTGGCVDMASSTHLGWIARAFSGTPYAYARGEASQNETLTASELPVWCCSN